MAISTIPIIWMRRNGNCERSPHAFDISDSRALVENEHIRVSGDG
jgi:hypothetical protein